MIGEVDGERLRRGGSCLDGGALRDGWGVHCPLDEVEMARRRGEMEDD
jgi:hypothetical protein